MESVMFHRIPEWFGMEGTPKQGHLPPCQVAPRWPWTPAGVINVQFREVFDASVLPIPRNIGIFYHPNSCMCCCAVLRSPQGLRKGLTLISFALNFISCKFNANAARTRPSSAVLRAGQDLAQDRGIIPGK